MEEKGKPLKAILVDDEERSRAALSRKLDLYCPEVQVVGQGNSVLEARFLIDKRCPDLLFLDIELGRDTIFSLLEFYPEPPFMVIFVTGYQQYALQAFRCSAVDYLLKPIDTDELLAAVQKALRQRAMERFHWEQLRHNMETSAEQHRLVIASQQGDQVLPCREVCYLEADGAYTFIYTTQGRSLYASKNLKFYEEALVGESPFYRVHHKYLVNVTHLRRIDRALSKAVLADQREIPVAKRRLGPFVAFVKESSYSAPKVSG